MGLKDVEEPLVYDLCGVDEHMGGLGVGMICVEPYEWDVVSF